MADSLGRRLGRGQSQYWASKTLALSFLSEGLFWGPAADPYFVSGRGGRTVATRTGPSEAYPQLANFEAIAIPATDVVNM
ncbi:hypothetical protein V2G26_016622 [Clonostachys chloroleuca]